jgi:hypothetical protein
LARHHGAAVGQHQPARLLYWNVGVAFTYKIFTLDLRYHDTDLTRARCFMITGDLNGLDTGARPGRSNWCSEAFIGELSVDTTIKWC